MEPLKVPYDGPLSFKVASCEVVGGSGLHYHELACKVHTSDYTLGAAM
jgi:hypothetical protein